MPVYAPGPALIASADVVGNQIAYDIAPLTSGGYVVTWTEPTPGTAHARTFDATGRPTSSDLIVDQSARLGDLPSDATGLVDGGFAVVASGNAGLAVHLYGADGSARGTPVVLAGGGGTPAITTLSDGRIAVAWASSEGLGPAKEVAAFGEILNADGTVSVRPAQIGPTYTGSLGINDLDLTPSKDGGFVLATTEFANIAGPFAYVQSFGPDGHATSANLNVSAGPSNSISEATLADGRVAILINGGNGSTSLRILSPDGSLGPAHQVTGSEVAALPDGNLLMADTNAATIYTPDGAVVGQTTHFANLTLPAVLSNGSLVFAGSNNFYDATDANTYSQVATAVAPTADPDGQPLVNDAYYLARYPDVAAAGIDPEQHYAQFGWREGRDPDPLFNTRAYLAANPDVAAAGIDPLQHYDQYGWKEGRDPSASFDTQAYLRQNPDIARAGIDPFAHYLQYGQAEGRAIAPAIGFSITHGSFDAGYYLLANPDVAAAGVDAYQHYEQYGWREGATPNAYFDTRGYLAAYADVRAAGTDPLGHYDQFGWKEGRDPSGLFDTSNYLAAYSDVAMAGVDPLTHFLQSGAAQGRLPFGDGLIG